MFARLLLQAEISTHIYRSEYGLKSYISAMSKQVHWPCFPILFLSTGQGNKGRKVSLSNGNERYILKSLGQEDFL